MSARPNSEAVTAPMQTYRTPHERDEAAAAALVALAESDPAAVPPHLFMPLCRLIAAGDRAEALRKDHGAACRYRLRMRDALLTAMREAETKEPSR